MPYGQVLVDTVKDSLNNVLAPASAVFRNRIINGAMVIDQRNAGASVTPTTSGQYVVDRWKNYLSQSSKFSQQQLSASSPVGFSNYLATTSLSAYSVTSTDYFTLTQAIEAFNTADLGWGTANAKTITLSFQIYSSLTGTFGGTITNAAFTRCYPFSYSIPVANTWTTISVTITGDTSGSWGTGNAISIQVNFGLGVGSTYSGTAGSWSGTQYFSATGATSVVGTSGATFYITGVQLEVGTNATSFEYRPYGTELLLCQRYFASLGGGVNSTSLGFGISVNTSALATYVKYPITMRAQPSAVMNNLQVGNLISYSANCTLSTSYFGTDSALIYATTSTVQTAFQPAHLICTGSTSSFQLSAEL